MEPGYLTLTYTRLILPPTDVVYAVQQSSTLSAWDDVGTTDEIISSSGLTQVVKAKVAITAETDALFLRLRVRRP